MKRTSIKTLSSSSGGKNSIVFNNLRQTADMNNEITKNHLVSRIRLVTTNNNVLQKFPLSHQVGEDPRNFQWQLAARDGSTGNYSTFRYNHRNHVFAPSSTKVSLKSSISIYLCEFALLLLKTSIDFHHWGQLSFESVPSVQSVISVISRFWYVSFIHKILKSKEKMIDADAASHVRKFWILSVIHDNIL